MLFWQLKEWLGRLPSSSCYGENPNLVKIQLCEFV